MKVWKKTVTAVLAVALTVSLISVPVESEAAVKAYKKSPKEIMYLKGVQETLNKSGKTYNLYDIDRDEIDELFVAGAGSKKRTVKVFLYDKKTRSAKKAGIYKQVTKLYTKSSKKSVIVVQKKGSKTCYSRLQIRNKKLVSSTVTKKACKNGKELILRASSPWVVSQIYGVADLTERPDEKTDFYFSSNYDYLTGDHIKDTGDASSHWTEGEKRTTKNLKELFTDRSKYTCDHIKRVRDYYDIATDWAKRDADGTSALKKILDGISSCNSLSELTEVIADPDKNPDAHLLNFGVMQYDPDTSELCMKIEFDYKAENFSINPYVKLSADDRKNQREVFEANARYILGRVGYSSDETARLLKECYAVEEELAPGIRADGDISEDQTPVDIASFIKTHTVFPLEKILNGYGVSSGRAIVYIPGYLSALDEYYNEENLQKLKSFLIVHNAESALDKLDFEAYAVHDGYVDGKKASSITESEKNEWKKDIDKNYESDCREPSYGFMSTAVESAYMESFVDPDTKKRITDITGKIKASLRNVILGETWLSEEGRQAAVEKLDNMNCFIMSPDEIIDTSYLNMDKTKSYYENRSVVENNKLKHNLSFIGKKYDRKRWYYDVFPDLTTTMVNAMYNAPDNNFLIYEGLLGPDFYNKDMTDEEVLGKIGGILGHEMTHGLDPKGSKYDKNGNLVATKDHPEGWFSVEDYEAFQKQINKVAAYYDAIYPVPWAHFKGKKLTGEAIGDMGGMAAALGVAKDMPGFDYKKFFEAYADLWCDQSGLEFVEQLIVSDNHPIRYLRVNVMVQQFDEFFEAYGIREGDGMYVAPEDRIRVW